MGVPKDSIGPVHHQHAALSAFCWRMLCDEPCREVEVEIRNPQAAPRKVHDATFPERARARRRALSIAAFNVSRFVSKFSGGKSSGTLVQFAQLTQIRVKGLGIRKRSHELRIQALCGWR